MAEDPKSSPESVSSINSNEVILQLFFVRINKISENCFSFLFENKLNIIKRKFDKMSRIRALLVPECGFKVTTNENYLKRLENIRKELNYISETDWMYDTVQFKSMKN